MEHLKQNNYFPALNGLRTVAIIEVLAFHTNQSTFSAGFLGVDLFFVISGFLITFLILGEFENKGTVSIQRFFLRRALRLMPALILVLIADLLLCYFLDPENLQSTFRASWRSILGISNWQKLYGPRIPGDLRHLWSLGVEFQFYLFWGPFCALTLPLLRSIRSFSVAAFILLIVGIAWRAILLSRGAHWPRIYYGTDARLDYFAVGAIWACCLRTKGTITKFSANILGILGLIAIGIQIYLTISLNINSWEASSLNPFLIAFISGILVASTTIPENSILKFVLSWKPIVLLGEISYGIYLWHYPILHLMLRQRWGIDHRFTWVTLFSTILAGLSYYLLEKPLSGLKTRLRPVTEAP